MRPVAFIGKAGSGKTTAADFAVELGYTKTSFAAPLKEIAQRIWGEDAIHNRGYLQQLGVAVRNIDEHAWSSMLFRSIEPHEGYSIVVDDCRFPNEYWGLKAIGFTFVRVIAAYDNRVNRLQSIGKFQTHEQLEHISETALDDVDTDFVIVNDQDQLEFLDDVAWIIERINR